MFLLSSDQQWKSENNAIRNERNWPLACLIIAITATEKGFFS